MDRRDISCTVCIHHGNYWQTYPEDLFHKSPCLGNDVFVAGLFDSFKLMQETFMSTLGFRVSTNVDDLLERCRQSACYASLCGSPGHAQPSQARMS